MHPSLIQHYFDEGEAAGELKVLLSRGEFPIKSTQNKALSSLMRFRKTEKAYIVPTPHYRLSYVCTTVYSKLQSKTINWSTYDIKQQFTQIRTNSTQFQQNNYI